jgi:hypothetical protein
MGAVSLRPHCPLGAAAGTVLDARGPGLMVPDAPRRRAFERDSKVVIGTAG